MSNEPLADIRIGAVYQPTGTRRPGLQANPGLLRARRRVILVHGFNAAPEGSSKSFDQFRSHLIRLAPRLNRDVKTLTWPGRALYWNAVVRAKGDIAIVLARYLARAAIRQPEQLVFVAHSLGCRLVLEALQRLSLTERGAILPRVQLFLMAAAVPTRAVAIGTPLQSALSACRRAEIYYSRTDEILGTVFTFGQLGDTGSFTEAVGWSGEPTELWQGRRHHMSGYLHGSYWKSETVAYRIALSLRAVEAKPLWRLQAKARRETTRPTSSRAIEARALERRPPL